MHRGEIAKLSLRRMEDHRQLQQGRSGGNDGLNLPPGFRFHPSDEEIINEYLTPKARDENFTAIAIGEADINKSEPWELPCKDGEKEWYFYSLKNRKYPTGTRANRATEAGYWKATGKDREIYHGSSSVPMLLGMKKTLVFYEGRAPNGVKTNWVMHEYRLDGEGRVPCPAASSNTKYKKPCSSSKVEWVVCRVFDKSSGVKKEPAESAPVSIPPYRMTMSGEVADLRSMSIPMPTLFPVGIQDFTMNSNDLHPLMGYPLASFYSPDGMGSSVPPPLLRPLLPPLLPMAGMGSIILQMDDYFGNSTAITEPMSLYQQVGIETTNDYGFVTEPDIRPTSLLLQDVVLELIQIINEYLTPKVRDENFTAIAIRGVDINKLEPWELPSKAKMGEKEWYFYSLKDRKYPAGTRANRSTEARYWKATGKDRDIYHGSFSVPVLLGMKKTLIFYEGRAPNGVKTNWVMHEYRVDGEGRIPCPATSSNTKSKKSCSSSKVEWVVCRVFDKSSGVMKEPAESAPVLAPPYRTFMSGEGADLRRMSIPMPTLFPVGIQDFTMNSNDVHPLMGDPSESFYSVDGMGSSVPPLCCPQC
ncbi:hypothetical protein EJB05_32012, partial [Eragrostis curvula]